MPEIGEVARIVYFIRKHLLGRHITSCTAYPDEIVYGKVGTSADAFQQALTGRRVTGADQQGKYFYVTFDRPPHAVMHFGMTGWVKFDCEETGYYKEAKEKEAKKEEWPPKYAKFLLHCDKERVADEEKEAVEAAFVDTRRLARIRLVECEAEKIRDVTPLKENGPDPVRDKDIVTVDWLKRLLRRKRVPVKALLLDQANLSGVGNWVADEVLYQARIHPEQYSNTFDDDQINRLHDALIDVCTIAVETLADTTRFPDTWLMKYRWDKGKKDSNTLPNGEKIVHLKVGGRTSAVVPSVQKKTAAVAGDVDPYEVTDDEEKPAKGKKRKSKGADVESAWEKEEKPASKKGRASKTKAEPEANGKQTTAANGAKAEVEDGDENEDAQSEGAHVKPAATNGRKATPKKKAPAKPATPGSRRSARTKGK